MIREPGTTGLLGEGPYFANLSMRLNLKQPTAEGGQLLALSAQVLDGTGSLQWFIHSDDTVDLAITPLNPPEHSELAILLQPYAGLLRKTGRAADAVPLEQRAAQILAKVSTDRMHPKN